MKNFTFDNGAIYQIWNDWDNMDNRGELRATQLKHLSDLRDKGSIVQIEIVGGKVHFISLDNLTVKQLSDAIDRSYFPF